MQYYLKNEKYIHKIIQYKYKFNKNFKNTYNNYKKTVLDRNGII